MKKCLIVISLVVALLLSACQATPTQGVVKEKNLEHMIEEATKTQTPAASASGTAVSSTLEALAAKGATIAERIGAEKTYIKELTDAKGKVKIHVNADISIPDVAGVSVQRVGQAQITQAQADTLVQRLMRGDLFSGNEYKKSKSELQNQILKVQAAIAQGGGKSSNPKDRDGMMLGFNMAQLQEELKTAPDQTTKVPCDSKLKPMSADMGGGEELFALSQPAAGVYQSLHLYNFDDGSSMVQYSSEKSCFGKNQTFFVTKETIDQVEKEGSTSYVTSDDLNSIPDVTVSKEDARKTADDLMQALGIQGVTCISEDKEYGGDMEKTPDQSAYVNPHKAVWFLRYARSVGGVPVTYTAYDCMKVEEDTQSAPWPYENIEIAVDDSGIAYFKWLSPYKIADIITENSNLLSFADAMNVFDAMCPVVNAWDGYTEGNPNLKGLDIKVDHIVFGLTRVTEQNKRNSGLLIPTWDFIGCTTYIVETDGKVKNFIDGPIPLLTVNAIDGSIIKRSLGY